MRLWVDSLKRGTSIVKKAMEFRFGQGESPQSLRFPLIQRRRKSMLKQKSSTAPSHNCPQQTTAHNNALTKYSLTEDQTRYLPTKADVKNFLEETYHREYKLEDITSRSRRWSFYAERPLTGEEIREWIERLSDERKATGAQGSPLKC